MQMQAHGGATARQFRQFISGAVRAFETLNTQTSVRADVSNSQQGQ